MPKPPKTRNLNTMTEAAYWSMLRSMLRRGFRYWKPIKAVKDAAKRPYIGPNKRRRFSYECAECHTMFPEKEVAVDHIVPVGSLKCYDDLVPFIQRLAVEDTSQLQVLCKDCHQAKTNAEKLLAKKNL